MGNITRGFRRSLGFCCHPNRVCSCYVCRGCCRKSCRDDRYEPYDDEDAVDLEEAEDDDDYVAPHHHPVPIQQYARARRGVRGQLQPAFAKRAIPIPIEYPTTGPVTTIAHFLESQIAAAEANNAHFAIVTHAAIDAAVGYPVPMEAFQHALRIVNARRNMMVTEGAPNTLVMDWRQEDQDLMRAPDTVGEPDDRRH